MTPGGLDSSVRLSIESIRARRSRGETEPDDDPEKVEKLLARYDRLTGAERELVEERERLLAVTFTARACNNIDRVYGRDDARTRQLPDLVRETADIFNWDELPMTDIVIHPNGDGAIRDVVRKVGITGMIRDGNGRIDPRVVHISDGAKLHLCGLAHGMQSGKPSAMLAFELPPPDGRLVMLEMSLRGLLDAADALKAAHGDPRKFAGETLSFTPDALAPIAPQIRRPGMPLELTPVDALANPTTDIAHAEAESFMGKFRGMVLHGEAAERMDAEIRKAGPIVPEGGFTTTAGEARRAFEHMAAREKRPGPRGYLRGLAEHMATMDAKRRVRIESNGVDEIETHIED